MVKNNIHYVSCQEAETIKKSLDSSIFIVELDGSNIQSDEDYFNAVWPVFDFPPAIRPSWDGYNDWIRDLDWLNADGYALFIYSFSKFMKKEKERKEHFIANFRDFILPFWEYEVTQVFVEGKAKPFNVYLVD